MAPTRVAIVLLTMMSASCAGGEPVEDEFASSVDEEVLASVESEPAPTPQSTPNSAPLSTEDVDRWRRGMAAELGAIAEAESQLRAAATAEDTMNALSAASEMSTRGAGARAAGIDEDRYQFVRRTLSAAVGYLSPLDMEMDVSQMPPAMVDEFERSRSANLERMGDVLPANLIETLRTEAADLRRQDVEVTAARVRLADAAR